MTGLRLRERDASLPARAGEPGSCAPPPDQVGDWIATRLLRADAPQVRAVSWEYARWKPGVSLTCTYLVTYADDATDLVVAKRYADGKDRVLDARPLRGAHWRETSPRLEPRAVVREAATALFAQPADRELPGAPLLLDPKRCAKVLRDTGLAAEGSVRRRKLRAELLRYKPERRAVYRLDVRLRDVEPDRFRLACRVLPPAEARRVAERRQAFEAGPRTLRTPGLAGFVPRFGLLLEAWEDIVASAPDAFVHAHVAGQLLARLHATPLEAGTPPENGSDLAGLAPLLSPAGIAPAELPGPAPRPARVAWCHGDFHPDQVARGRDGEWWLLDLDRLMPGDPARDLASWIADALVEGAADDVRAAAEPLLAGYVEDGGVPPADEHLAALVADELVQRAAGAVRRLEAGALELAPRLCARAREVLSA